MTFAPVATTVALVSTGRAGISAAGVEHRPTVPETETAAHRGQPLQVIDIADDDAGSAAAACSRLRGATVHERKGERGFDAEENA